MCFNIVKQSCSLNLKTHQPSSAHRWTARHQALQSTCNSSRLLSLCISQDDSHCLQLLSGPSSPLAAHLCHLCTSGGVSLEGFRAAWQQQQLERVMVPRIIPTKLSCSRQHFAWQPFRRPVVASKRTLWMVVSKHDYL